MSRQPYLWAFSLLLWFARSPTAAHAETLLVSPQARAFALPDNLVACSVDDPAWTIDAGGRQLHAAPDDAIGRIATVMVAPTLDACAHATARSIVRVASSPQIDAAKAMLDEGRLLLTGRNLEGAIVRYASGDIVRNDRCANVSHAPVETCELPIPPNLSADPSLFSLFVLPRGAPLSDAVTALGGGARWQVVSEFAVTGLTIVLNRLFPPDAVVDLSEAATRIAISHPEAIADVSCVDATCVVQNGTLAIVAERGADDRLDVRIRFRPRVGVTSTDGTRSETTVTLPVVRCPVELVSGALWRTVATQHFVLKVTGACSDAQNIAIFAGNEPLLVQQSRRIDGALYLVAQLDRSVSDTLSIALRRADSIVASAVLPSRALPEIVLRLQRSDGAMLAYVPTNAEARVLTTHIDGIIVRAEALEGIYSARCEGEDTCYVRGVEGALGSVSLVASLRSVRLPNVLSDVILARVSEPTTHSLRETSKPIALEAALAGTQPMLVLRCGNGASEVVALSPGITHSVPFRARDTCKIVFVRDRMAREFGPQAFHLDVHVYDTSTQERDEAHVSRTIRMRPHGANVAVDLGGVTGQFDRMVVRLSHDGAGPYESFDDADVAGSQLTWTIVFGTDRFRLYATASIPSGLFRISKGGDCYGLPLNAGTLLRLAHLGKDGQEFPVVLETGLMWLGIADGAQHSFGEAAVVAGLGISVPFANSGTSARAAVNLHAWFEWEVSHTVLREHGSPLGFVFGPSISIGDFGVSF